MPTDEYTRQEAIENARDGLSPHMDVSGWSDDELFAAFVEAEDLIRRYP